MCIFLVRHFSCMEQGIAVKHSFDYLVRCANPEYADCIKPKAITTQVELYDSPCHVCTGKFVHPRDDPVDKLCSQATKANGHHAALSYVRAMCDIMLVSGLQRWPSVPLIARPLVTGVTRKEMACRFNKDHFDKASFCDCTEANSQPELHNLSTAFRQVVARSYLLPRENDLYTYRPRGELDLATQEAHEYFESQIKPRWTSFKDQPDLSALNVYKTPSAMNDVEVIPFYVEDFDRNERKQYLRSLFQRDCCGEVRVQLWALLYRTSFHTLPLPTHEAAIEQRTRLENLIDTMICLVATDAGLSLNRAVSITKIICNLLTPNQKNIRSVKSIDERTALKFMALLSAIDGYCGENTNISTIGAAWCSKENRRKTEFYVEKNRQMRLDDEYSRADAIEKTVTPLTQEQVDNLPDDEKDCIICCDPLGCPGDGHAAVRLNCPSRGHVVGMSCWMKTWRYKRHVRAREGDGIMCLACAAFKLGD